MRLATRIVATSLALLLPATSAMSASCNNSGDHAMVDPELFPRGSIWRMIITGSLNVQFTNAKSAVDSANATLKPDASGKPTVNPSCSQWRVQFTKTNEFTSVKFNPNEKVAVIANPEAADCDWAVNASDDKLGHWVRSDSMSGKVATYCYNKGDGPRRYANVVIYNPTPYGATYAVMPYPTNPPSKTQYLGWGADGVSFGQIVLVREK